MKSYEFLNALVAYYWSARDFRRMKNEMGAEAFEANNWQEKAAAAFVCDNLDDCKRIFNHRHFPRGK